ncbi:hypothetical protein HMPREF9629_01910 [Peptoanaerobacter stomatis]|uniref:GP-PDE domain-containing protein n=1 Tax=Peptoanaerobacter stomatis TaxID=796937 RepID=G9X0H4_9FIRM|nr:glycerophosphodiester phosphodiesterase family protein [Peptoanaerobacter stomatis]EHL15415.1 hypothetical protein HMPREF9629_01910 [Peptoanaerobacter stomatis]EHL17478.1 hypothetical protein HMPREF9628_00588 [Peptoanaerobacter stomatis]
MKRKILPLLMLTALLTTNTIYAEININDINNSVKSNEASQIEKPKTESTEKEQKVEDLEALENKPKETQTKIVDVFKNISNSQYIVRLRTQSKQELQSLYDRGFRVFEITVSATLDNQIVLADNFSEYFYRYYEAYIQRPTIDEYFSYKMKNGETQMSIGDINVFLNNYPDARFFVKSLDTEKNVFDILNNKSFKNKDKLIIETTDILGNYKTFDNVALVDLKGENNIYSFAVNNKDKNIMFVYQNTSPNQKEMEEIKKAKRRVYEINKPAITNKNESEFDGYIYSIEDIVNLPIAIPQAVKSNNYIRPAIQNDRFIAHAGGKVLGIVGTNTLQAMNSSYARGNRILEIDFDWTTDGKIVQLHDWASFKKLTGDVFSNSYYMKYEEFKNKKMINSLKQMSIDDTLEWLKNNTDAYIVTDVKEDNMENGNIKALTEFANSSKEIQSRFIPQIYDTVQYQKIKDLGYKNIIYTLYRTEQSPYGVLEFAKCNDLFAVTMDNLYRVYTTLPELLTNNGIRVYIHTENDKTKAKAYINGQKAYGIYSDDILSAVELNS